MTMSALSGELGISHSATTQIADRLERAGMVERVLGADDRRCKSLRLTARGVEVMQARLERRIAKTVRLLESLSPQDREAAISALGVLLENTRSGGSPSPPAPARSVRPPSRTMPVLGPSTSSGCSA